MNTPERFDWEREHSALTPEGRIEAAGAFGRGLGARRTGVGRFFLIGAVVCAILVVIGIVQSF